MNFLRTLFKSKNHLSVSQKININFKQQKPINSTLNQKNNNPFQTIQNSNSSPNQKQFQPQAQPKQKSFFNKNKLLFAYIGIFAISFGFTYYYKMYKSQKQYFKKQQEKKQIIDKLQQLQQTFSKKVKHLNETYPTTEKRMEQKIILLTACKDINIKSYYNTRYLQNLIKCSVQHNQCQNKYDNYKGKVMKNHFNIDNIQTQIPQLQEMINCYDILENYLKLMQTMMADPNLNDLS